VDINEGLDRRQLDAQDMTEKLRVKCFSFEYVSNEKWRKLKTCISNAL